MKKIYFFILISIFSINTSFATLSDEEMQKYKEHQEMLNYLLEGNTEIFEMEDSTTASDEIADVTDTFNSTDTFNTGAVSEQYDGTRFNQACTPPTKDGNFANKIYTTGQFTTSDPAFEKAMITKFRAEGGVSNHKNDHGGYTKYGVSSKSHPEVLRSDFSRADAEKIAYNSYYKKYNIDKLPDAIRGDVFMAFWGTGSTKNSIGLLQKLMGIPQTNKVDTLTIETAKNYKGDLRNKFLDARAERFKVIAQKDPSQIQFLKGWLNGIKLYRANGCHSPSPAPISR